MKNLLTPRKLAKWLRASAASLLILAVAGCAPTLETNVKLAKITGRVLDAETRLPIKGARVALLEHPRVTCRTHADGTFQLGPLHNLILGVGPGGNLGPSDEHWLPDVSVSREGYITAEKMGGLMALEYRLGDVLLQPKRRVTETLQKPN